MSLQHIHEEAMKFGDLNYDHRLRHIHDIPGYEGYKVNTGHTYYLYLRKLIRILQPEHVVELGTSTGRSALFMMLELPEKSKFTTIELGSYQRVDLEPFWNDPRLSMIYGDDTDPFVYGPLGLKDIDFLYIDSLHEKPHVQREWDIYQNFLRKGAIVVMDDIHINQGLCEFWASLPYPKIACPDSVHFSGFGIFLYQK